MKIDRFNAATAALLACSGMVALTSGAAPAEAAAKSGVPPFCVMTGAPRGGPGGVPQICRFFDYQECLWAAADLHGNCVVNIDYRGPVSMSPAQDPVRVPRRRY